jgi:hypothetical protein
MFTRGAFALVGGRAPLMSAEYDHVIDVPHISYDEWVAFHNEVAFDLWGYEVEKQIFKLVALDGTSEHLDRRGTLTSKINPIPIFLRPIVGHEPMTFECHAKWGVHRNDKQRPNESRTIVLSPRGLVGKLIVDGIQWAEPLPSGGVRVHSNLVVTVRVGVHIVDKTAAFLCLKRAESNLNALPDQVARYLEHRKSAVGASVVRRLGTWSAALVKSTAWTALDTAAAEAATAAAAAGALEGIVGAEEEVATPGATRNLQQRGTTFWLREHTGLLPAPPSQTPAPASASTASSASSASFSRYGAQEPPPLGSTPSSASTEEEEEEEEEKELQKMGAAARARFLRKPEPVVPPLIEGTAGVLATAHAATGQVHVILEPKSSPDFVAPRNRPVVPSAAAGSPVTGARSAELPSLPARLWTENARASTEVAGLDESKGQEQLKWTSEPAGLDESRGQEQLKSRSELAELKELKELGASVEEWRRRQRAAAARARFLRKPEPVVPPLTEGTAGVLAAAHVVEVAESPHAITPPPSTLERALSLPKRVAQYGNSGRRSAALKASWAAQRKTAPNTAPIGPLSKPSVPVLATAPLPEPVPASVPGDWGGNLIDLEDWSQLKRAVPGVEDEERFKPLRSLQEIGSQVRDFTDRNVKQLKVPEHWENFTKGLQEHVVRRPKENLEELGHNLAEGTSEAGRRWDELRDNVARGIAEHVGEPVQEFSLNLAKGVDEHVAEPVREFSHSLARGVDEHIAKPVREIGPNFAKGTSEVGRRFDELRDNVARGIAEHVGEPVQEFSLNLAKGVDEHVAEPVREFSHSLARGVDERVAEPVRKVGKDLAKGVDERVAEPVRQFVKKLTKDEVPYDL